MSYTDTVHISVLCSIYLGTETICIYLSTTLHTTHTPHLSIIPRRIMRLRPRRIPHDVDQHRHPARQMPQDMAVEEPHARVVRAEPEHGVSAPRDLDRVAEDYGAREVVRDILVTAGVAWIRVRVRVWRGVQARWEGVFEGVVGAPADGGFVGREDVEVVTVLWSCWFWI